MATKNYCLDASRPAFSSVDDDESAFMNSSSAPYLAANRMGQSEGERIIAEAEERRGEVLKKLKQVEKSALDSSKRTVGLLVESETVGVETAKELSTQREQLKNTENRLDGINSNLKDTQKNINGIKSVFSNLKQWWRAPKSPTGDKSSESKSSSGATSPNGPVISPNLSSAVGNSEARIESARGDPHPSLQLRGIEQSQIDDEDDFRVRSKMVNQKLDDDLDLMSSGISRLKDLASGLGNEIVEQNAMVDRIHVKADKADITIGSQNKQMNRIIGKK